MISFLKFADVGACERQIPMSAILGKSNKMFGKTRKKGILFSPQIYMIFVCRKEWHRKYGYKHSNYHNNVLTEF